MGEEWSQGDFAKAQCLVKNISLKKDRMIDNPRSHEQLSLLKNVQPEQPASEQQPLDNNVVVEDAIMALKLNTSHVPERLMQKEVASRQSHEQLLLQPQQSASEQQPLDNNSVAGDADMTQRLDASHIPERL